MKKQIKTTQIKNGISYAKVSDRLNEFRSGNPNSKIKTVHTTDDDGNLISKSYIWKDKNELIELLKAGVKTDDALCSADAEGTARMQSSRINNEKAYEKNETIAVGRALALLGYSTSGEIASSEEMEEFIAFKAERAAEVRARAIDKLKTAMTMDELAAAWRGLEKSEQLDKQIQEIKDSRKAELCK